MKGCTTQELMELVRETDDIESVIKENTDGEEPQFSTCLKKLLTERHVSVEEFSKAALISRSFAYQLLQGKRLPERNKIIRMSLELKFTFEECERLLKLANKGSLYPKIDRDAVLINSLEKGLGVEECNRRLTDCGLETIP